MIATIISFLIANSEILTILGMILVGLVSAIISKDKQRVYTKLYSLCVEAETLGLSNQKKLSHVLDFGYNRLPFFIKTFVSEDNVRRAVIYSLDELKKFSALKMGVNQTVTDTELISNISEVQKIEDTVKKVVTEGKTEAKKLEIDVEDFIVGLKNITSTDLKTEGTKIVKDVIAKDSATKIESDVISELPLESQETVREVTRDFDDIEETVENVGEVIDDVKKISEVAPIVNAVEDKIIPVVEKTESKAEEVKTDIINEVAKVETVIKPLGDTIITNPIVEEILPIAKEIVPEVDVVAVVAKIQELLASINVKKTV